jgi:predicted porin
MKKTFLSIISALFIASSVNAADFTFGVSASYTMIDGSGTETTRTSNEKNNGSANNDVVIGSIFVENNFGSFSLGIDYIPFKADVSDKTKSRTETDKLESGDVSVTNKAQAEISNHITLYALYPFSNGAFIKAGVAQVDVATKESLGTGETYGDDTIYGGQIGLGFGKNNWRLAVEYTDYETISLTGSGSNKIDADLDTTAVKLSYNF